MKFNVLTTVFADWQRHANYGTFTTSSWLVAPNPISCGGSICNEQRYSLHERKTPSRHFLLQDLGTIWSSFQLLSTSNFVARLEWEQ